VIAGTARVSINVEIAKGDAMRKVICALLLALFVGGLVSCKAKEPPVVPPPAGTEKPAAAPAAEKAPE
jgi:hypothetical protein